MPEPRLSLLIPAFNEGPRIEQGLRKAHAWLSKREWGFEIVVIDDGSSDDTGTRAAALRLPGVRVERMRRNQGKGAALRHGVERVRGTVVVTCDADFSTPIWEVERVLAEIEAGADIVIASREHPETRIPQDQHPLRKGMGRMFNRLVRSCTGLPFADTQCGFKGFRGPVAHQLYRRARINGFATDVELLVIARESGLRVVEIPVEWSHAGQSRVRLLRHPVQMFRDLLRIASAAGRGEYR